MSFMESQGVDGHVGEDFCFFVFVFFHDGLKRVLTQCDPRAVLRVSKW